MNGAELSELAGRVVFLPVRHHSPACARRVRELAGRIKPAAILIEGPGDFNERIAELYLPHTLPIAIYSYVKLPDGSRSGAYYPMCVYSPEWQAVQAARELGCVCRFIDVPWHALAGFRESSNRYADAELRRGAYVARLCRKLGVDGFDALWDTLFEQDGSLPLEGFMERCHDFCLHSRLLDGKVRESDCLREAYMAARIRDTLKSVKGKVLVVTGGYHSSALWARVRGRDVPGGNEPAAFEPETPEVERGLALTPYSYERLDSLAGYDAGMPNPGFYHEAWEARQAQRPPHRALLARVAGMVRERNQPVSAADLIAAEATAVGLARLRGHRLVWRRDLIDGITGALVKEELSFGLGHPLLDAVHEVFRGGARGRLAQGTALPPLVYDLRALLAGHDLEPQMKEREVDLELTEPGGRSCSRILHRLRILSVKGFEQTGGTNFASREDLSRIWERWKLRWNPDYEATSIEAARYGPTLGDAAAACLVEAATQIERNAERAALLLVDAALGGLPTLAADFLCKLEGLVRGDADFFGVTRALDHLLYLYRHDTVLECACRDELGRLLHETFSRGLWLLEGLGQVSGRDRELLQGIRGLLDCFERCDHALELNREEFLAVLTRVASEGTQTPVVRGACTGALWTLGETDSDRVRTDLLLFAEPDTLGDFLTGLFCLAREVVQRHKDLVRSIDDLLVAFADEEFLRALPALRLAFTFFTPREKHHLALTLMEALGVQEVKDVTTLTVSPEQAAQALLFEGRLFEALQKYGLRGGNP